MLTAATSIMASASDSSFEEASINQSFEEEVENYDPGLEIDLANLANILARAERRVLSSQQSSQQSSGGITIEEEQDEVKVIAGPLDNKGRVSYVEKPTVINTGNEAFQPYPFGIGGYSEKEIVVEITKESNQYIMVGKRKSGQRYGRQNNCGDTKDFLWVSYHPSSYGQYVWISSGYT